MTTTLPNIVSKEDLPLAKSIFLLAYTASLRISEYASTPANHALQLKSLSFSHTENNLKATIILPSYKSSKRPAKLAILPSLDKSICPISALLTYLRTRGNSPGNLYLFPNSSKPVTPAWVNSTIKKTIENLDLDPSTYSSHSFRAGRTTDLVSQNTDEATIMESGRWKSNAFQKYVRFDIFDLPPITKV